MKIRILVLFCLLSSVLWAQEEKDLLQIYRQAEEEYAIGRFDTSIRLLDQNMANFSGTLRTSAYRLLSLCWLGKGRLPEAERYASSLLKEDPYYSTSINDPLRFADLIERLKRGEEATITTASQQAESVEEAPVPVTLITEEMIKASGARTLADLLTLYVPGMTNIEGFEANVTMHGVYSSSQEKILIMLDGHRLNSRTTNVEAPDYRTSLDKIKQIEVLRGPASSLYGNVALTAVVNIITKKGREVNGVKLSAGIGNNQSYRADFLMGRSGLGFDFLAWASVYSSEGEERKVGLEDEEFNSNVLVPGRMYIDGYNHQPAYDIGFAAEWNEWRLMFNTQYAKKVPVYGTMVYQGLYSYDRYRTVNGSKPGHARQATHIDLSYEKSWGESWHGKFNAFCDLESCSNYEIIGDSVFRDVSDDLPIPPGEIVDETIQINKTGVYQVQAWNDYTLGGTVQANYNFKKNNWEGTLLLGSQAELYTMKDNSWLMGDRFDRIIINYSDAGRALLLGKEINYSAFTQLKVNYKDFFIFNGGIRYDYKHRYNEKVSNVLSPRLSFIYKFNPDISLKLGYSHSFVDAPYLYRGSTTDTYAGGTELGPEQMDAVQLTFNHSVPDWHLKYEANVYYNHLMDLIYCDLMQQKYYNSGSLDVMGIESVLSYANARSMANVNLSYQWVLDNVNYASDGVYIHYVPNFRLGAMYRYKLLESKKYGNAYIRANTTILSKQKSPITRAFKGEEVWMDVENEEKARAIFNVGLDYEYKKISANVDLYNVFNTQYYQGGATKTILIPQQSISFLMRLSYKF